MVETRPGEKMKNEALMAMLPLAVSLSLFSGDGVYRGSRFVTRLIFHGECNLSCIHMVDDRLLLRYFKA